MTTITYPVKQTSRDMTIIAWVVTLVISSLPDIIFNELSGSVPSWLVYYKMGLLILLVLLSFMWSPIRPLRNYFLIMFAFFGFMELRLKISFSLPFLQSLFGSTVFDSRMQAEQTGKLVVSLAMIAVLLTLGYKRSDFFLARGDLRAPINPVPVLGFRKPVPWYVFGLQWGVYIAAALGIVSFLSLRPGSSDLLKVVPILPSIIFYAGLNAFNEEMTYRAPMIATTEHVGGSLQALWMSAYFFGIAHYFGTPGEIIGGVLSIFMGWILGKGMVETRGLFWSWWIHFLSDIVIFTFLTLMLLK